MNIVREAKNIKCCSHEKASQDFNTLISKIFYFPGWVGWWVDQVFADIKAISAQLSWSWGCG